MVRLTLAVMAFTLALGACGSDDSSSRSTDAGAEAASPVAYGPCSAGTCGGSLTCVPYYYGGKSVAWCAAACDPTLNASDCPAPPGGKASPSCIAGDQGAHVCALGCGFGDACPTGMVCSHWYCGWP